MSYSTDLTDAQWALIEPILTARDERHKSRGGRPPRVNRRQVINALLYQARTGCQWRMLPNDFPKWETVRWYFDTWTWDETWDTILIALTTKERERGGRDPAPTAACIDSQSTKTTESGGIRGFDGGKKGGGTQTPHRR